MRKMKAAIAWLLCAALCLCAGAAAEGYAGTIALWDFSGADRDSAPMLCLERVLADWQEAHPETALVRGVGMGGELAALALTDKLPDVMLAFVSTGRLLGQYGRICDLTDAVLDSEYLPRYDTVQLMPFVCATGIGAFPALRRSNVMVIYDPEAWTRAGLDGFPDSWEALREQRDALSALGYSEAVGLGYSGGTALLEALLSPMLTGDSAGWDWFQAMIQGTTERTFLDDIFIDALDRAAAMLPEGVLSGAGYAMSAGAAVGRFIEGACSSVLVIGDPFDTLERVREEAPELYARLEFAPLPVRPDGENPMPASVPYGLFISARAAEDPDKLAACVELCRYLTGPAYANLFAAEYGRRSFTEADDAAWARFRAQCDDPTRLRLLDFLADAPTCPDVSRFIRDDVWSVCAKALVKRGRAADSDGDPGDLPGIAETANSMQDAYEQRYLEASYTLE